MRCSSIQMLQWLLFAGMVIGGAFVYPALPESVPSHWGLSGNVDGWMQKDLAILFAPAVALILSFLLPLLERLDPKREHYSEFRWQWEFLQLTMVAFFAYVYALQMAAALSPAFASSVSHAIFGGVGILFAAIGIALYGIRSNFFVGIRTPWTLMDDDVWRATHRLASGIWIVTGLLIALESLVRFGEPWIVFLVLISSAVIIPVLYSYILYHQRFK